MLKVFSNEESLANAAAAVFVSQCKKSIARSGRFSVVLSGGNTPRQTYELIAKEPFRSQVDWTKVHVFWGDERLVDKSDDRSNFRLATDALLSQVPIPPTQVHPISAIRGPEEATREYESIIRRYFSQSAPRFDLVLLGLGVDGHTASIFPGPPEVNETHRWVTYSQKRAESFARATLTPNLINQAAMVLFLVTGRDKASILEAVLAQTDPKYVIPARLIHPTNGELLWLVDECAHPSGKGIAKGDIKIAPSLLAADFARLGEQLSEVEQNGADRIHLDVMDGHFVPNLAIGTAVVRSLRNVTKLRFETHLMISEPDLFIKPFAEAGSDSFLVHCEGNPNLNRTVQNIKSLGKRVGVVINPATPASALEEIIADVSQVLVMTVNPGFGNQPFIYGTLHKIRRIREMIDQINPECDLEVDGGIDVNTAPLATEAGANVLVAGSAIFQEFDGITNAMNRLKSAVNHAGNATQQKRKDFGKKHFFKHGVDL